MPTVIDPTRILDEDHEHTNENYADAAKLYNRMMEACHFEKIPTTVRGINRSAEDAVSVLSALENLRTMADSLARGLERVRTVRGLCRLRDEQSERGAKVRSLRAVPSTEKEPA